MTAFRAQLLSLADVDTDDDQVVHLDPGDELLRERAVKARLRERVWELETAVGRRLLRHNAGPGPACDCEECRWARPLLGNRLAEQLRAEEGRYMAINANFEDLARARLEEVARERAELDEQLRGIYAQMGELVAREQATKAALATYERELARPRQPVPWRAARATDAQRERERESRPWRWAATREGRGRESRAIRGRVGSRARRAGGAPRGDLGRARECAARGGAQARHQRDQTGMRTRSVRLGCSRHLRATRGCG